MHYGHLSHLVFSAEFMDQITCLGVAPWYVISGLQKSQPYERP